MSLDLDAIRTRYMQYAQAVGPGGERAWRASELAADVPELLAELAAGSDLVQSLEQQLAERGGPGIDARLQELAVQNNELSVGLASARKERDELRQHILDIDAHATPYGDIPDDPSWVGVYLLTAGALHRALGKIGHGAPKCETEAALAAVERDRDWLNDALGRSEAVVAAATAWRHAGGEPGFDAAGALIAAVDEWEAVLDAKPSGTEVSEP